MEMEREYQLSRRSKLDRLPPVDVEGIFLVEQEPFEKKIVYENVSGTDTKSLHRATLNGKEVVLLRYVWSAISPYTGAGVHEEIWKDGERLQ